MSRSRIEGNWKEHRVKSKQSFGKLTDDCMNSKRDHSVDKIQETYHTDKSDAQREINELTQSIKTSFRNDFYKRKF